MALHQVAPRSKVVRDTAAGWESSNPILEMCAIGIETDTQAFKIGNGKTRWSLLPYTGGQGGGGGISIAGTFTNADLDVDGKLIIQHNAGMIRPPYLVVDNTGEAVIPYGVLYENNKITLDFSGFTPLSGSWVYSFGVSFENTIDVVKADTMPIGLTLLWPSGILPQNHLWGRGGVALCSEYPELFAVYGIIHGGDGVATFGLPDMRDVVPVGKGVETEFSILGAKVGSKTHALTAAQNGPHTHGGTQGYVQIGSTGGFAKMPFSASSDILTSSSGGGSPHPNIQPSVVVNWIIKAKNTVPIQATVDDNKGGNSATDAASARRMADVEAITDKMEQSIPFTPTISASVGTITSFTINKASYVDLGKLVYVEYDILITNAGSAAGHHILIGLPFVGGSHQILNGRENSVTGVQIHGIMYGGSTFRVWAYNNGTSIQNNYNLLLSGMYRKA